MTNELGCTNKSGSPADIDVWPYSFATWHTSCNRSVNTENSAMMSYYVKNKIRPPCRPYYLRKYRHEHPPGIANYGSVSKPVWKTCAGPYNPTSNWLINHTNCPGESEDKAKALAIATRRYYSALDSLDLHLGVTIAEAPKTFALVATTATRMYTFLRSFKRGDVNEGLRALGIGTGGRHARSLNRRASNYRRNGGDFLGDTWLEVKYGWQPLLSDVRNGAEALSHKWEAEGADVVVRTKGESSTPFEGQRGYYLSFASGGGKAKAYIGGYFRVIEPNLRTRANLGLSDVASVAWELLPWSFVIDWFAPIGDYLAAQNALSGLSYLDGYETTVYSFKGSKNLKRIGLYDCDISESLIKFEMKRIKRTGPPPMTRIISSKDIASLLNLDKAATSLALLNSLRR